MERIEHSLEISLGIGIYNMPNRNIISSINIEYLVNLIPPLMHNIDKLIFTYKSTKNRAKKSATSLSINRTEMCWSPCCFCASPSICVHHLNECKRNGTATWNRANMHGWETHSIDHFCTSKTSSAIVKLDAVKGYGNWQWF